MNLPIWSSYYDQSLATAAMVLNELGFAINWLPFWPFTNRHVNWFHCFTAQTISQCPNKIMTPHLSQLIYNKQFHTLMEMLRKCRLLEKYILRGWEFGLGGQCGPSVERVCKPSHVSVFRTPGCRTNVISDFWGLNNGLLERWHASGPVVSRRKHLLIQSLGSWHVKTLLPVSPCLFPGAGVAAAVAAAAVILGVISHALVDIVASTGLQTQAPPRHPGWLVHSCNLVLPLKL